MAQVLPQPRDEPRVRVGALLAEIGQRAHLPEARAPAPAPRTVPAIAASSASRLSTARSIASGAAHELGLVRRRLEIGDQRGEAVEPRLGLAPEQPGQRREAVLLDRVDFLVGELGVVAAARCPPSVPKVPSRWCRPARPAICAISDGVSRRWRTPSNLRQPGEGDMA